MLSIFESDYERYANKTVFIPYQIESGNKQLEEFMEKLTGQLGSNNVRKKCKTKQSLDNYLSQKIDEFILHKSK